MLRLYAYCLPFMNIRTNSDYICLYTIKRMVFIRKGCVCFEEINNSLNINYVNFVFNNLHSVALSHNITGL